MVKFKLNIDWSDFASKTVLASFRVNCCRCERKGRAALPDATGQGAEKQLSFAWIGSSAEARAKQDRQS